jgi:hypothetical protein
MKVVKCFCTFLDCTVVSNVLYCVVLYSMCRVVQYSVVPGRALHLLEYSMIRLFILQVEGK